MDVSTRSSNKGLVRCHTKFWFERESTLEENIKLAARSMFHERAVGDWSAGVGGSRSFQGAINYAVRLHRLSYESSQTRSERASVWPLVIYLESGKLNDSEPFPVLLGLVVTSDAIYHRILLSLLRSDVSSLFKD